MSDRAEPVAGGGEPRDLRVAVMGAGAIGGYFGARFAASGVDVTFVARGEHLRAMQNDGLRIKSIHGDLEIHSEFISSPDRVAPVHLVLLAVKSQDTEEAARSLAPFMGRDTAILSLQNGVDNTDKIARLWGSDRSLAGVAYISARISAPGVIEHSGGGRVVFGTLHAGGREHARLVHSLFAQARLSCDISPDIRTVLWEKLAWNAPFCALSCLLRMTVGDILGSASLEALVTGCIDEVRDAARCRGTDLPPSTAQEALIFSTALRDVKPSMLQDLEAGRPLEHEALNGIVVKILQQSGKRAPINEILYSALSHIDQDLRAKQSAFTGSQ
jgi:2-dehydropantoate 2-reductase